MSDKARQISEGLRVMIESAEPFQYTVDVSASGDIFYAGTESLTNNDAADLRALGWAWDAKYECWFIYT